MATVDTVPAPFATLQICVGSIGWLWIVTEYAPPDAMPLEKVNPPLPVIVRALPPLSASTRPLPERPLTVPPIAYVLCATPPLLPLPMEPLPLPLLLLIVSPAPSGLSS